MPDFGKPTDADSLGKGAVTVNEAAAFLSVSPETVRRLVQSGSLAHARIGGAIRIPVKQLQEYLEGTTTRSWQPLENTLKAKTAG